MRREDTAGDNDKMSTPYSDYVGNRDPVEVLAATLAGYQGTAGRFTPAQWAAPWAPGKWTARQLLVHVAQWEMIFGTRVRCAVSVPGYVIQAFDQDPFMHEADAVDGPTAYAAFIALRTMNLAMVRGLAAANREKTVTHPERGLIPVESLIVTLAGHAEHHLAQLRQIA